MVIGTECLNTVHKNFISEGVSQIGKGIELKCLLLYVFPVRNNKMVSC
jgi:hypothetical protein